MKKRFLTICLNPTIQKTLVFESLCLDHVNRATITRTDASGKGVNVTRVLNQLGADAIHLTHAGGPDSGWFLEMCKADGLDIRWVDSQSPVRFCTTVINTLAGTATELVEESVSVVPSTEARLLELYESLIAGFDVVTVSGTKASGYSSAVLPTIIRKAAEKGALTILDIKGQDLLACLSFRPTVVKPNLAEFLTTVPKLNGKDPSNLRSDVQTTALEWKKKYGTDLVITRSSESVWFNENGIAAEEEVQRIAAVNPTGSGDAFTAGLAYALAAGWGLREAVKEGIRLGSLNAAVLKPGSIRTDD